MMREGKSGVAVDVKALIRGDRVRVERGEAIGVGELGGLPVVEG